MSQVSLAHDMDLPSTEMRDSWGGQLWLDDARHVELIPDLAVRSQGEWRFVGDVVYKALRSDGARQDDGYQMLAYSTATGLSDGTLIYVGIHAPDEAVYLPQDGQRIRVASINLDSDSASQRLQQYVGKSLSESPRSTTLSTPLSSLSDA